MLGPIMQNGFVVHDWREAAMHWVEKLGVGPFFVLEHIPFAQCFYRGTPADIDMTVAIAYTGNYQIELVQQHNDEPSIYKDFLDAFGPGLQHVGTLVDNLDKSIEENGFSDKVLQHGQTTAGQRFAYVDTVQHNGTMLELIETDQDMEKTFEYMRHSALDWDGTDPIRS